VWIRKISLSPTTTQSVGKSVISQEPLITKKENARVSVTGETRWLSGVKRPNVPIRSSMTTNATNPARKLWESIMFPEHGRGRCHDREKDPLLYFYPIKKVFNLQNKVLFHFRERIFKLF
jgi:hypothetical protein